MALSIEQIRGAAERVARSHGLSIVDIEYLGGSKNRLLRVFIEKSRDYEGDRSAVETKTDEPEAFEAEKAAGEAENTESAADLPALDPDRLSGVTHEDCERFSRDFGTLLDVEDLVPGAGYTLEVSSPGLDRPLVSEADYLRFVRSLIKVRTRRPLAGNRHWQGRLTEVTAGGIVLDLTATRQMRGKKKISGNETIDIAFENIEKANLVPEI